ncbi:MAG: hypothetical protein ACREBU_24460, partial [Nitrososphaera sp.]
LGTDKDRYAAGEDITISGIVNNVQSGQSLLIQVMSPIGYLARIEPISVAADGSWTYTFPSGGNLMSISGAYRVISTYRGTSEETTFEFAAGEVWSSWTVIINNSRHELRYQIAGGAVNSMRVDVYYTALSAIITTTSYGVLRFELPRSIFDSKDERGKDTEFVVFIDGVSAFAVESVPTDRVRILDIPFDMGAEEITIVGSK